MSVVFVRDMDIEHLTFLSRVGVLCRLPTLIFAECVLIYIDPAVSRQVVKWSADKFETAAFIIYEQVRSIPVSSFWNLCGSLALY